MPYWGLAPGQDDPYQSATQPMLAMALSMSSVKTVIFSTHLRLEPSAASRVFIDAARDTFRRFTAAGKQVIVMEDVPTLPFDPRSCIKRAGIASSATTWPCSITRAQWDAQIKAHRAVFDAVAKELPQVRWFTASSALCDDDVCRAMIGGRLMYRDMDHLSYDGDLAVGRAFASWATEQRLAGLKSEARVH